MYPTLVVLLNFRCVALLYFQSTAEPEPWKVRRKQSTIELTKLATY